MPKQTQIYDPAYTKLLLGEAMEHIKDARRNAALAERLIREMWQALRKPPPRPHA